MKSSTARLNLTEELEIKYQFKCARSVYRTIPPTINSSSSLALKSSDLNVSSGALPSLGIDKFVAKNTKLATKLQQNIIPIDRPEHPYEVFINEKISRGLTKSAISGYKYHLSSVLRVIDSYSATKEDIVSYMNSIPVGKDNDLVTRFAKYIHCYIFAMECPK